MKEEPKTKCQAVTTVREQLSDIRQATLIAQAELDYRAKVLAEDGPEKNDWRDMFDEWDQ